MTAVEFLIEQFKIPNSDSYISKTFQQALEMEKQQIMDAFQYKFFHPYVENEPEKYYNETYKKPLI
jgi:hypothetical protein